MENIGDKDAAIAERLRALLAAANNTATTAAAAVPATVAGPAAPVPIPPGRRRLDPSLDPATVVANLTAAGIQLAVRKLFLIPNPD
jgi:tagatose-1,6-bisphosphate aldolase non-catalytic subunit AgaZ/GatZ